MFSRSMVMMISVPGGSGFSFSKHIEQIPRKERSANTKNAMPNMYPIINSTVRYLICLQI